MKRINLKGLSEVLGEKELKNVMGGSTPTACNNGTLCDGSICKRSDGTSGYCKAAPFAGCICWRG